MEVKNQSIVALLGGNGTGKSTILKACSGIIRAWKGTISFDGEEIQNLAPHKIVEKGLVQVTQGKDVFPAMTVLENLRLGGFVLKSNIDLKNNLEKVFNYFPRLNERKNQLVLSENFFNNPYEVIFRSMTDSIKIIGGKYNTVRGKKIDNILNKIDNNTLIKETLGGCIIKKLNQTVIISKEY